MISRIRSLNFTLVGKSWEVTETHHALLGEQTYSQIAWQDVRSLSPLRRRWKDRRWKVVPRYGYGLARQKFRRLVPRMQTQVWFEDCVPYCALNGKFENNSNWSKFRFNASKKFTKRESFIVILNLTTSLSEALKALKTTFILSTSVSLRVTKTQTESTFLSEKERI